MEDKLFINKWDANVKIMTNIDKEYHPKKGNHNSHLNFFIQTRLTFYLLISVDESSSILNPLFFIVKVQN